MASRSLCGCAIATGPVACMQPDKASAVMAAIIGNRNARATRTLTIPHSETAPVLHRLWLTNRFCAVVGMRRNSLATHVPGKGHGRPMAAPFSASRGGGEEGNDQALTPAPIGQDTPV